MSVAEVAGPVLAMSTHRYELGITRSRCRSLFGPIDHDQLRNEQREELTRIVKEKELRWNFDFVNQRPLVGDFEWERIGRDRSVGFTTIASRTDQAVASSVGERTVPTTTRSNTNHEGNATNRTRQGANSKVNCLKTPERTSTKPQRRSPRITDYLRGTKKSGASRQIKFGRHAGDERISTKQVHTSEVRCRGRISKQSTLDELLPKLRPRHVNGKASS